MKEKGLDKILISGEAIGQISRLDTIINQLSVLVDNLNSLVNSLKSEDTDMININHKSSEIMVPVDIQAQSPILIELTVEPNQYARVPTTQEYDSLSINNKGYLSNDGVVRNFSYYDGGGIYDGKGIYD